MRHISSIEPITGVLAHLGLTPEQVRGQALGPTRRRQRPAGPTPETYRADTSASDDSLSPFARQALPPSARDDAACQRSPSQRQAASPLSEAVQ